MRHNGHPSDRQRSDHVPGVRKLVMLDYDGVIVDSLAVFCRIVPPILAAHGFPHLATREDIIAFDDGNWFESLASANVPMSAAKAIEDALAAEVTSGGSQLAPFEGMPEVMARLAERHSVVIVTSSHSAVVEDFLWRHGMSGVRGILGSDKDTSKVRKINEARRQYGEGLDAWYIGDTVGDIIEGKAAGVGTIGAAWGWHSVEKLQSVSPDHIAYAPNELLALSCLDAPTP
jgi:phosphoglycolate phosphatase